MIHSLKDLPKILDKLGSQAVAATRDVTPTLQKVDEYLIGRTEESFRSRSSPDGTPWPGRATLVKTGGLFALATAPGKIGDGTLVRKIPFQGSGRLQIILQRGAGKARKRKKKKRIGSSGALGLAKAARMAQKAAKIAADIAAGRLAPSAFALIELLKSNRPKRKKRNRARRRKGKLRIPPRPFEGITPKDADRIAEIVADETARRI